MKNLFTVSNGEQIAARILKAAVVLLTTCALGAMFWMASMPALHGQEMSPAKMVESQLPAGKTMQTAGKADFLAAVCAAVQKFASAAPQIARAAADAHPEWKKDTMRTIFRCLGTDDCRLLGRVLRALSGGSDSSELTELAVELAPGCASNFGGGRGDDGGGFGNAPGNLNPPPGSIGGGGGQGNVIAICHSGRTIFVSPQGAENHLRNHPGDTLGPCQVTPITNR